MAASAVEFSGTGVTLCPHLVGSAAIGSHASSAVPKNLPQLCLSLNHHHIHHHRYHQPQWLYVLLPFITSSPN